MITPCYITKEMDSDFEESIRLGAEAGFHTVAMRPKIFDRNIEELTAEDLAQINEILARYKSTVSGIYTAVGKCSADDREKNKKNIGVFRSAIALARSVGTDRIRIFPFQRPGYTEYEPSHLDEYLPRIVENLKPIIEIAESESIVLRFECVGSTLTYTAQDIRRVIDALGNPSCAKVIWEIDVASKAGESPTEGYSHIRGLVDEVHVKANANTRIDPLDAVEGTYEEAFGMLAADGFNGCATIEHWKGSEGILNGLGQLREMLARIN